MLLQPGTQVGDLCLQGRDPGNGGLELHLLILDDLHEYPHHGLDARRGARPIGLGDP